MKSVTEFANVTLSQALKAKEALVGEGKSVEEIQAALGEKFKMAEEKLKHFWHALEVAVKHPENLKRILVQSYAEGESAPHKSTKVEEHHYTPDFHVDPKRAQAPKEDERGGRGGKGRGGKGGGRGNDRGGGGDRGARGAGGPGGDRAPRAPSRPDASSKNAAAAAGAAPAAATGGDTPAN